MCVCVLVCIVENVNTVLQCDDDNSSNLSIG